MLITEFCKAFFDKEAWKSVPDTEKLAHGFNILRFLSIKYPYHINLTNHKDMNMIGVLNFWHSYITPRFTKVPQWFWTTAGENKKRLEKEKIKRPKTLKDEFSGIVINSYCTHTGLTYGDLQDEYEMNPDEMIHTLKKYKDILAASEKE